MMRILGPAVLTAFLMAVPAVPPALADADALRRISVSGEGRIVAAPDMATLTLGVVVQAPAAAAALAENSAETAAVLARLQENGVAERDLQTAALEIHPRTERSENGGTVKVVGYEAVNRIEVRIRDLDRLGAIVDAAVRDGANRLHGLSFGIAAPEPLHDAARTAAVVDARRKAELMAAAAGTQLGPVLEIHEGDSGGAWPVVRAASAPMMARDVPIAAGEIDLAVKIRVTWALQD